MRLESLTIQNFRSITTAYKLPLSASTILIGPNNEGKSNVLRGLVLATRVLLGRRRAALASHGFPSPRYLRESDYDWERDFPLDSQGRSPSGESVFILEYSLTPAEIEEFREAVGSKLNGTLPLRVALGNAKPAKVTVHKKGRGAKVLSAKASKIAEFVADRIDLEYIPAVRTAASAQQVVDSMVSRELSTLEERPDYQAAIGKIAEIQQPVLEEISKSIRTTLVQFLPAVRAVDVRAPMAQRFEALRRCEILVNDGSMTELRYKGDGVQSLAALALMRHASSKASHGKSVVIAIEEPESHLHPKAIHELRSVVRQLGESNQVVLTTHCPLFVSRKNVGSNILVNNRKARPAATIDEIREILGVRAADNLQHAELVLVVEGEDDRVSLRALIPQLSAKLERAMEGNRLAIDTLGGATNLAYKLGLLRDALCEYHVFLDDDDSGRKAYDRARESGLLLESDVNMARCHGMKEAEFEDLLAQDLISLVLRESYGIVVPVVLPALRRKKWSVRMQGVFISAGKPWDDKTSVELKWAVARAVARDPGTALNLARRSPLDALVRTLEHRLG